MLGVTDAMASPSTIREDVFVLSRLNNRLVTGQWSVSLLRDVLLQFAIMAAAFAVFFGFGSRWLVSGFQEIQLATMQTAITTADIIDQWTARCGKNGSSTCYYVRYRYEVDGKPYFAEEQVDSELYRYASLEPRARITYAVDMPSVSHLGEPGVRTQKLLATAPIVLLVIFLLFPAIGPVSEYLRVSRMRRKGNLIYGTLRDIHGYTTGSRKNRRYYVTVNYEFTTPDGRMRTGTQKRCRRDLRNGILPMTGTPVAVLYVDDSNYLML